MSTAATDLGRKPESARGEAQQPSAAPTVRTTEDWVRAFADGWRDPRGADGFISHFREILAEDIRLIQPQLGTLVGREAFEERFVRPLFALIPDLSAEVERWAVKGEEAFIEITLRGTLGGRAVAWRACDRITVRDGLALERETYFDPSPLLVAIARTPRAWPRFAALQIKSRAGARSERRKTR